MQTKITPAILLADDSTLNLRVAEKFRVDKSTGTLHDLALMTAGREAAGHGIYIDQKTIQTGLAAIETSGGQLRAAIKHPSLLDHLNGKRDRVLDMPGFFSAPSIVGNKLVLGKFEFFDAFKAKNPDAVATILEMADKAPGLFGLSAELSGPRVFVAKDGAEYVAKRGDDGKWTGAPEGVELANGGMPTLRIQHLGVGAFVDHPAANDGLFAKLSSFFSGAPDTAALERVIVAFSQFLESGALHTAALNKGSTPTQPTAPMPLSLESINAKFGADKARLSAALLLAAAQPALTIEALEAGVVQGEFTALKAEVTRLTTELATAQTALTAATTERDSWKAKFEKAKDLGFSGLDLGAGAATAGADNPWAAGKINFTKQCELLAANPALAAQLMAAAGVK